MLLNASSPSSPVLTHSNLATLFLSDNNLHGLIPALPTQLVLQLDLAAAINLTNAAGINGFGCPLPSTHAVYASASCTCAAGRSVGAVQGIGADENVLLHKLLKVAPVLPDPYLEAALVSCHARICCHPNY